MMLVLLLRLCCIVFNICYKLIIPVVVWDRQKWQRIRNEDQLPRSFVLSYDSLEKIDV